MPTITEVNQAVGARASMIVANETAWGNVNLTPTWRAVRLCPGETLDSDFQTLRSRQIRNDRMHNRTVLGTQRSGGTVNGELSYTGWPFWIRHLLGGTPTTTGAGDPYTHVIKGASSLPQGFTLEKQFNDLNLFAAFMGCRINSGTLRFGVDKIVDLSFDIMCQSATDFSGTSVNSGSAPAIPTEDPFTSTTVSIYEDTSLDLLGIATDLTITVNNHLFGDRGFILGSNYRQNLKPGTREVTASGSFLFSSASLYDKAINGTATKLKALCTIGTHSVEFLLPNFRFLPNRSMPKISDDGPLSFQLSGEALNDAGGLNTDIQATIITSESEFIA